MGEYEPTDSRKVTGTATNSGGRWAQENGIEPERTGVKEGESRDGENAPTAPVSAPADTGRIREHMQVVGADGAHVGTVDRIEGDRIKLTKDSASAGFDQQSHAGHHHYIAIGLVADVEGDIVRLSATGANAVQFEEEPGR